MYSHLQQQIQARMERDDLNANALEKKSNLSRSAVRNILKGRSKKPSAEILMAIANTLHCTVDDLVGPSENSAITAVKATTHLKGSYKWDEKLYLDVTKLVSNRLADKKLELKFEQVMALTTEAYRYSIDKSSDQADQDFVNWVINKNFKRK